MHADHYLDVVALRYLFPWGHPASERMPLHLPPGGRDRIADLARAINERDGFFDAAFTITEYDPTGSVELDGLRLRFVRGRHYVPAWGIVVDALDGTRVAYSGDTGPSPDVEDGVRDADLLLVESALADAGQDDTERGHLTAEEAVEFARRARARSALLVHFAPDRKTELDAVCAAAGPWVRTAVAGLTVTVRRGGPGARLTTEPNRVLA